MGWGGGRGEGGEEKEAGEGKGGGREGGRRGKGRGEGEGKVVPVCFIVSCSKRREGFPPSIQEETGIHGEGGTFSKYRD